MKRVKSACVSWITLRGAIVLVSFGIATNVEAVEDLPAGTKELIATRSLDRMKRLTLELNDLSRRVSECNVAISEASRTIAQKFTQYIRLRSDFDETSNVAIQILAQHGAVQIGSVRPPNVLRDEIPRMFAALNTEITFDLSDVEKASIETWVKSGRSTDLKPSRIDEKVRFIRWWMEACQRTKDRFKLMRLQGTMANLSDFKKGSDRKAFSRVWGGFLVDDITSNQYDAALETLQRATTQPATGPGTERN
jgi:hypothetical protein